MYSVAEWDNRPLAGPDFLRILRNWAQRQGRNEKHEAGIFSQSQNSLPSTPKAASRSSFNKCSRQPLLSHQTPWRRLLWLSTFSCLYSPRSAAPRALWRGQPCHLHVQGELGRHALPLPFSRPLAATPAPPPTAVQPAAASAGPGLQRDYETGVSAGVLKVIGSWHFCPSWAH